MTAKDELDYLNMVKIELEICLLQKIGQTTESALHGHFVRAQARLKLIEVEKQIKVLEGVAK